MDKQKPFTLFVPPRLSSSQVSAVKPQTLGGDSNFMKVNLLMYLDLTILYVNEAKCPFLLVMFYKYFFSLSMV